MQQADPRTSGSGAASEVLLRLLPNRRLRGPTERGRMGPGAERPVTDDPCHYVFSVIQPGGAVSCASLGPRFAK